MKVLSVIPGLAQDNSFVFVKRGLGALRDRGIVCEEFYFRPSTSPLAFVRDLRSFHRTASAFRPDVVHAQFGTFTSFLATFRRVAPTVITLRGNDVVRSRHLSRLKDAIGKILSLSSA